MIELPSTRQGSPAISVAIVVCAFLFTAVPSSELTAQESHAIEITPLAGGGLNFGQVSEEFEDAEGVENQTSVDDGLAIGLLLGVRLGPRLSVEGTSILLPTQISARGGGFSVGFDVDIHILNAGMVYLLRDSSANLRPFLTAGGGVKRYSGGFATETDPSWNLGGGMRLRAGDSIDLRVEIRDYMSSFEAVEEGESAQFQHDVIFATGVSFGLF